MCKQPRTCSPVCIENDAPPPPKKNSPHVVLQIWLAPGDEQYPAGLVVPVLAAEVQGGEPSPVLHVDVGPVLAQEGHRPAVALPRGLVQSRVAVLKF